MTERDIATIGSLVLACGTLAGAGLPLLWGQDFPAVIACGLVGFAIAGVVDLLVLGDAGEGR